MRLLGDVNPDVTPDALLPPPLVACLPEDPPRAWPLGFSFLDDDATAPPAGAAALAAAPSARDYPRRRRAQRLSFGVWSLVEAFALGAEGAAGPEASAASRQAVLEVGPSSRRHEDHSGVCVAHHDPAASPRESDDGRACALEIAGVAPRLRAACEQLRAVNDALRAIVAQRDGGRGS